ncbi:unnamed protein product [Acanthoscelides obtectus]|uniref:Uncharacterized protein n=1 Tax=Acanthoscelides obtectus TaxID=200917 RepID=A0A9P0QIN1_ACAOB|nr:unnamed protein product [Acanthoscelides obtectus]CAK1686236.1 Sodium/potassium-transporting ATPase subunit beta-2 [Acanthoscelides obtectus]
MLAALVAICMWVFFQTLDPRIPKWQLDRSLIGTNPGLGFRPMPMNNEESTLIWFQGSNKTNYQIWVDHILQFLDTTNAPGRSAYNRIERRMAPLSRELANLILPHDHFGSHLDERGVRIDEMC